MKDILAAAAILAAMCAPASADVKYDRSLDEAAARIVAEKIGDIRGSFDPGAEPALDLERRAEITGSVLDAVKDPPEGLVRARDPQPAALPGF